MEDGSFYTTFEYKGAVNLPIEMKLFDGSGAEIVGQEDVWLYYHSDGSALDQDGMYGQVVWNESSGYYEGILELKSGGTFVFNRIVTNKSSENPSTVRKASLAPVFLAYVTDPPEYMGHNTASYQFAPNGDAAMNVTLTNAQTSTMWAEIEDLTTGTIYMVSCTNRIALDVDTNLYRFEFDWSAQLGENATLDGNWQMLALYMQGIAKPNEDPNADPVWVPVSGTEPTVENCYVISLAQEAITAYVVETVNITITADGAGNYNGQVFGKDGNTVTGQFMQSYNSPIVVFTVKDWNGQPIQGIAGITWEINYNEDSLTYGGYTGAYQTPPTVALSGSGTTYTLPAQTFYMAGSYTSRFTIAMGDTSMSVNGPSYQVWSVVPTIAITAAKSGSTSSSTNASFTATSTTVYFVTSTNSTCGITTTNYTQPYVDITLANIGFATEATLDFGSSAHLYSGGGSGVTSSGRSPFTWTANGACRRYVGSYTYKSSGSDSKTAAGDLTATQLVLTYNGIDYTIVLSTPITISNPS